jgi:hypothetical protein
LATIDQQWLSYSVTCYIDTLETLNGAGI